MKTMLDWWKRKRAVARARKLPREILFLAEGRENYLPHGLSIVERADQRVLILNIYNWEFNGRYGDVHCLFGWNDVGTYDLNDLVLLATFCKELNLIPYLKEIIAREKKEAEARMKTIPADKEELDDRRKRAESRREAERKLIQLLGGE